MTFISCQSDAMILLLKRFLLASHHQKVKSKPLLYPSLLCLLLPCPAHFCSLLLYVFLSSHIEHLTLSLSVHLCFFDFVSAVHFYWNIANSFSFLRLSSNIIANTQISWPLWQPNAMLLIFMETVTTLKENDEYCVFFLDECCPVKLSGWC